MVGPLGRAVESTPRVSRSPRSETPKPAIWAFASIKNWRQVPKWWRAPETVQSSRRREIGGDGNSCGPASSDHYSEVGSGRADSRGTDVRESICPAILRNSSVTFESSPKLTSRDTFFHDAKPIARAFTNGFVKRHHRNDELYICFTCNGKVRLPRCKVHGWEISTTITQ